MALPVDPEHATLDPEALARGFLDIARTIVLVLDGEGRVLQCNEPTSALTGYPVMEIVGQQWTERFVPARDRARVDAVIASTGEGRPTAGTVNAVLRRDGTERLVEWYDTRLSDASGRMTGVLAIGIDVTEQRGNAELLRDLAITLSGVTDLEAALAVCLDTSIRVGDMDSGVVFVVEPQSLRATGSRGFSPMLLSVMAGLDPASPPGRTLLALDKPQYLDAAGLGPPMRELALEEGLRAMAYLPVRYQGQTVAGMVLGSHRHEALPSAERPLLDAVLAQFGSTLARLRAQADKERLEDQLRQAIKMEAVGRLAGGVAHDFNNILTAIVNCSELALDQLGEEHPARDDLTEIRAAAGRASELTRQLLAFSSKQVIRPLVVDLNEVIARCQRMLARIIGEDVALTFDRGPGALRVLADPTQLEQVLVNLAVNARDAMPKGGSLFVATQAVRLDEDDCRGQLELSPGDWVRLTVRDTGTGVDEEVRRHMFEPFFTTKAHAGGTGLGLATVYGAVQQNHGAIQVESSPGAGATFIIHLPAAQEEAPRVAAGDVPPVVEAHGTVLVVEDESMVRVLATRLLRRAGYRVLEARSGPEALEVAGREGPFDLLLTDVIMPGMNGKELYESLAATRPGLPVIFVSGYTNDVIARHGVLDGQTRFLQKPFSGGELIRQVGAALAGRSARAPA